MIAPTEIAVPYAGPARGIARVADVYLPEARRTRSVVIVHGGGWVIGSRAMKPVRFLASRLAAADLAVCAIDYRMMFRGGRLTEATTDVALAVAWWKNRTTALGLDPGGITLLGLSAGASLSMLAAAGGSDVRALACCFGLYELDALPGVFARLLVGAGDRQTWQARSPRAVAQPAVPTLLLHGSADRLVPAVQAQRLAAHRSSLGLPTRLVIYDGAPHGFFRKPGPAAEAGVRELTAHALA
ncbi:MAG: alpha/beta hydrolase [Deltaproteobacteria bacterium]|nr:alpha/beta hydrolase [Deltaproteobacteria bacterium]